MDKENIIATVDRVLEGAARFLDANKETPGIEHSYGYFCRHIVASLNRRRLIGIAIAAEQIRGESRDRLKVLELGCGGGIITSTLASMGMDALGVDIDEIEIALAKNFSTFSGSGAKFIVCDVLNDNWEEAAMRLLGGGPDIIVLAYALHHFRSPESIVDRIAGLVGTRSAVIVNEENPWSPTFRLKHVVRTILQGDTDQEWHKSEGEWVRIFKDRGFGLEGSSAVDMFQLISRVYEKAAWSRLLIFRHNEDPSM